MIKYLKSMLYTLTTIITTTIIITLLNYFNLLNGLPLKITSLLIPITGVFIGSFLIGKNSNKKGYIEGLKYGIIWIIILLIINLISKNFTITSIISYIALILMSTLSASLGINKKN